MPGSPCIQFYYKLKILPASLVIKLQLHNLLKPVFKTKTFPLLKYHYPSFNPLLPFPIFTKTVAFEGKTHVKMKRKERSHRHGDFRVAPPRSVIEIQQEKLGFLRSAGAAMLNHIWIHSTRLLKYHRGGYWHISMKTPWPH